MVVSTKTIDGRKPLRQMNKAELFELADALGIDYKKDDTNKALVEKIEKSGKFNPVKESHSTYKVEDGKRVHKKLGPYKKVIVNSRNPKEVQLFFSIGVFTFEFRAGEVVELPQKMIDFIKSCYEIEHVYDPNLVTPMGNVGGHTTKKVQKYFVETVDD
jgi:hypothetical protein